MPKMIFVNLPVIDLPRSTDFYQAIGARRDERFCDETASCMVLSDTIFVMLLTHEKFGQFTPKKITDAWKETEVLLCVSEESRAGVDATVEKALAAGAKEPRAPQDFGFMYNRSFEDLDGHIWEIVWMDVEAAMAGGLEQIQS
ncbi:MAG TPA: VOC family protein [Rhizorhapis sp.]|nr:VOC family protein [Rhizorhapis sp.]